MRQTERDKSEEHEKWVGNSYLGIMIFGRVATARWELALLQKRVDDDKISVWQGEPVIKVTLAQFSLPKTEVYESG